MENQLPDRKTQLRHFGKLLLRILLPLVLIGLMVCFGLDWWMKNQVIGKTPSHGAAKLFRIQEPHPGEIAILGSSRALCSFIPDSIGPNVYNYGINGVGYAVMDLFMEQLLARPDTAPIVLNMDYEMFYYQVGDVNSYLPHLNQPGVRPLLQRAGYYSPHMELPGIRYYGCVDAFMKDHLNERLQLTKTINKGAVIDKSPFNPTEFAAQVQQRLDSTTHLTPYPALLQKLEARFRAHRDRRFILVVAPYHKSYRESLVQEDLLRANAMLAKWSLEPNVELVGPYTDNWPDSLFTNTTHVNLEGAIRMSRILRQALGRPATPVPSDSTTTDSLHSPASQPTHHP